MARVSVQCPGCLAKLNLPDDSKLGKKIKCPKCSDIFVAEADDDDDSDDDEKPKSGGDKKRPGAQAKRGGTKGKSSSGGEGNPAAIIGGIVAVFVLIGAGLFFSGVFGGGNQPLPAPPVAVEPAPMAAHAAPVASVTPAAPAVPALPVITPSERTLALRWMPANTEVLLHVKVAELWNAALLKELVNSPMVGMVIQEMQSNSGLTPADIESFTFGMADLQKMQESLQQMKFGGAQTPPPVPKMLIVIRLKKSLSHDEILKASRSLKPGMSASEELKLAEYNSKKYIEVSSPGQPSFAAWLPEPTTLILSETSELKLAMDRGETVIPRKELAIIDAQSHVILIAAPKDPKSFSGNMPVPQPQPGMSPELAEAQKILTESMTGFGLGISIRGGIDLQTSLILNNADGAVKVKTGLDSGIAEGKKQFQIMKFIVPPPLSDLGDTLLNNLKIDVQSQTVRISTQIPDTEQAKIEQAIMMAMGKPGRGGSPGFPLGGPATGMADLGNMHPGDTEPVTAELAEGIPDGTTLTAHASWAPMPTFSADGKAVHPMQLMLDLQGEPISGICGFGQISFKTSTLGGGGTMKVSKANPIGEPSPTKAMLAFDSTDPSLFARTGVDGTMRLSIAIDAPPAKEKMISSLVGTFKILTFDEFEEFTIEDAPKVAKRPLADPPLKAAGVKLLLKNDKGESLTLSCAKGYFIGSARATLSGDVNAGEVVMPFASDFEKNQPIQRLLAVSQDGRFPEATQIQFKLYKGVKEQTVSFKFADIALPSPASKPALPTAQPIGGPPGGFGGPQPPMGQIPNNGPQLPPGAFPPATTPMPIPTTTTPIPTTPQPAPQPTGTTPQPKI